MLSITKTVCVCDSCLTTLLNYEVETFLKWTSSVLSFLRDSTDGSLSILASHLSFFCASADEQNTHNKGKVYTAYINVGSFSGTLFTPEDDCLQAESKIFMTQ